jgi:hypothetical protein
MPTHGKNNLVKDHVSLSNALEPFRFALFFLTLRSEQGSPAARVGPKGGVPHV